MRYVAILAALGIGSAAVIAVAAPEGAHPHRAAMAERFKAADTDGNGQISLAEAQAALPRVAKNFHALDANHDGQVSLEELRSGFQRKVGARAFQKLDADADGRVSKAEALTAAEARFDAVDTNHDGFISPEEARAAHAHGHRGHHGRT
jgi:Ca2+-binding EF-hand superfamily protein